MGVEWMVGTGEEEMVAGEKVGREAVEEGGSARAVEARTAPGKAETEGGAGDEVAGGSAAGVTVVAAPLTPVSCSTSSPRCAHGDPALCGHVDVPSYITRTGSVSMVVTKKAWPALIGSFRQRERGRGPWCWQRGPWGKPAATGGSPGTRPGGELTNVCAHGWACSGCGRTARCPHALRSRSAGRAAWSCSR